MIWKKDEKKYERVFVTATTESFVMYSLFANWNGYKLLKQLFLQRNDLYIHQINSFE